MKIGKCLVSSDLNPLYLDFFPTGLRAWTEILGIKVVLVLIADEIPINLQTFKDDIILFPPIAGVHSAFQAQCARLLIPQLTPVAADEAIIISDIDMVPMNNRYYTRSIRNVSNDKLVVYRSNVLRENREIAICYNADYRKSGVISLVKLIASTKLLLK